VWMVQEGKTPGTRLGRESISAFSAALKVVYIDVTASLDIRLKVFSVQLK